MKLYHATKKDNVDSIIESGIVPSDCSQMAYYLDGPTLQGTDISGVYGWTDIRDAEWFVRENCWRYEAVIVSFEADDDTVIDDPEFVGCTWIEGQSKFFVTTNQVPAKIVCEY